MLSYQHIYHAGNMADVHKHLWLLCVLEYLGRKDKPYIWIDTHAGRGGYDLTAAEAQKIKEYEGGILKIWNVVQSSDNPILKLYADLIGRGDLLFYPGSSLLAAKRLRGNDKLFSYEMHPQEFGFLEKSLKLFKNAKAIKQDGYNGLASLMPPMLRRGGVLIDPSYEVKDEYVQVAQSVRASVKKWSQGVFMIWYPILAAARHEDMCANLSTFAQDQGLDSTRDEWMFKGAEKGMLGSGMFIMNTPYTCAESMGDIRSVIASERN